jgi:hypothetical protein
MDIVEEKMTKSRLLEEIQSEHQRLQKTLAMINEEMMFIPGVIDEWTVKDILAHITVWEQRMVRWLGEAVSGDVPQMLPDGMTWDDLDEWNEQTYQKHRHRPVEDVLADYELSYPQALDAAKEVPEQVLMDADRFDWREGDPLWVMVAANTFWHYTEHEESIRAWLARLDG